MSQWPGPECGLTEDEWDDPLGMRLAMKKSSEILDQFVAENLDADQRAAVGYVMQEMHGKVNPNTIGKWFRERKVQQMRADSEALSSKPIFLKR